MKLTFSNSKGDTLVGILSNPTNSKEKPIIILCHGFSSSKERGTYTGMEERLNRHKISTFRFDFYGHGESDGKFEDITISEAVNDILQAMQFLKKQGYKKLGLLGSSFGGQASILAAAQSDALYVLALRAPVSNYLGKLIAKHKPGGVEEWKQQGFIYYNSGKQGEIPLKYSFYEDAEKIDGYAEAAKIKIPTIIVHGDKDASVPVEQSKKLATVIPGSKLVILKGANHGFSEDKEKCLSLLSQFIVENLNVF
jgi:uncharacterized protein